MHTHMHTQFRNVLWEEKTRDGGKEEDTETNLSDATSTKARLVAKRNTWHDANDCCNLATQITNKQCEGGEEKKTQNDSLLLLH